MKRGCIYIRTVKKHDVRKQELISIAEQLFLSTGYEQTSVNTIIEQAGVAKGTFYHYFKSKENVLDEMVAGYIENIAEVLDIICKDSETNALEKLQNAITTVFGSIQGKEDLFGSLHEDSNIILHHKVERKMNEVLSPLLSGIMAEGVRTGTLRIKYPPETAEYLMVIMGHLFNLISMKERRSQFDGVIYTAGNLVESMLGVEEGSLDMNFLKELAYKG